MRLSDRLGRPRYVLVVFTAATLVFAAALAWLGWRQLQLDRALLAQTVQERLDGAADLVAATLLQQLSETDAQLARLAALSRAELADTASQTGSSLADGGLLAVLGPQRVDAYPQNRLPYYPFVPAPADPPNDIFTSGEVFEYEHQDYEAALTAFRAVASVEEDPGVQAGALLRIARVHRKANRPDDALNAYDALAEFGTISIGGAPADLVARHARCELFDELGRSSQLNDAAESLSGDLHSGRWRLTRGVYRFYAQDTLRWLGSERASARSPTVDREAPDPLAAGVESLWEQWLSVQAGSGRVEGRRSLQVDETTLLLVWRGTADHLVALVAAPRYVERVWLAAVHGLVDEQALRVTLSNSEGLPVLGQWAASDTQQALRPLGETGLPWTVQVVSADPGAALAEVGSRRLLLFGGLSVTMLAVVLGSYFTARAITRELEVAQLQSSFVSAVSHEFRTPLASLRQMSELLADGRVSSDDRRQGYYEALRRESERLHRLVEGLLDFGRMEAGAREYRFELVDPREIVHGVVEEFGQEASERGYHVELDSDEPLPLVRADREALPVEPARWCAPTERRWVGCCGTCSASRSV